ncbi:MAG: sulfatase-like hydrolase/transferase [Gemmatimonadaceae bacterium]
MTNATTRSKLRDVLWLGAGCAMAATLYYLLRVGFYLTLEGGFASVSRDVLWMAPLSHLLFFGVVALPVLGIAYFLPRAAAVGTALVVFLALALFGVLMPWTQITRMAALIVAIGAAVALRRRMPTDPDRLVAIARRWSVAVLVLCAVSASLAIVWRAIATRRDVAAMPAPPEGAPNVLLIILDTVRSSALSLYGYGRRTTPELDTFAQGGTVFETAIAPAPWTLPSHATIFTGRYPAWLNLDFRQRLDDREPTLAELLRSKGYTTLGIAANMGYASWESGLSRGFTEYHDYPVNLEQVMRSSMYGSSTIADKLYRANTKTEILKQLAAHRFDVPPKPEHYLMTAQAVTDRFLRWRRERDVARPYFAFLNYFDAHDPYTPPDSLRRKFAKPPKARDLYDAEIFFMDYHLGRLFKELERDGALKNTLVIVAADHGEQFGERGLRNHANSVYTALVHVPLVIRFDGHVPAGQRIDTPVSLRDIGRTVLDLAGIGAHTVFPGHSLQNAWTMGSATDSLSAPLALLERVREDDPSLPAGDSTMIAAFDARWHLIRMTRRLVEEMFDYHVDSAEEHNMVGAAEARDALTTLRALMRDALLADRPPRASDAKTKALP